MLVFERAYYTLAQALERVGQELYAGQWTGAEVSAPSYTNFGSEDAELLAEREGAGEADHATEPTCLQDSREPQGDLEKYEAVVRLAEAQCVKHEVALLCLRDPSFAERLTGADAILALEAPENAGFDPSAVAAARKERFEAEVAITKAPNDIRYLKDLADIEAVRRLRNGRSLSEFTKELLHQQRDEWEAHNRRNEIVNWITERAWSGDDTPPALTTAVFERATGGTHIVPANNWGSEHLYVDWKASQILRNDPSLPDGMSHCEEWSRDGVVGFPKADIDRCLTEAKSNAVAVARAPEPVTSPTKTDEGPHVSRVTDPGALYLARLAQFREETGHAPTIREDEEWGRKNGLARDDIRGLRRQHRTDDEKKGGHPKTGS